MNENQEMVQGSIFELPTVETFKIDKPIRLIELFAGYGSQALALKYLGANFESWKIAEWAVKSIQAYKDLHKPDDNTDYSKDLTDEQVFNELLKLGISADYSTPMDLTKIKRLGAGKARQVYNNIKATNNLVSVCNIHGDDLEIVDTDKYTYIMTYSFPCFVGSSLVLTDKGYKPISKVEVGDRVLTHKNTYEKVLASKCTGEKTVFKVYGMAVDELVATENHKFYARKMGRKGHECRRVFYQPEWVELQYLDKSYYLGIAINQNSIIPEWNGVDFVWKDGRKTRHKNELAPLMNNKNFWWLIGRYLGDGWVRPQAGIVIACNYKKVDEIREKANGLIHYSEANERTVKKFHFPTKEIGEFCKQFGRGAANKHLTNTVFDLPVNLLKSFLDGYFSADGYKQGCLQKACSVSRELIYGIGQCVAKVYHTPYKIYKIKVKPTTVIEGRTVNQKDCYQLCFKKEKKPQDKAFYENGYIWYPIYSIEKQGVEKVYDIEVENNHSFTVQNTIVHNCQDLSNAGLRAGLQKGTRSGLLWEVERILYELKDKNKELPQVLLMENVSAILQEKNYPHFLQWVESLKILGYNSSWKVLNSKDFNVPQNRERCFMVSLLSDKPYNFPVGGGCKLKLKDLLEKEVDKKYFIPPQTVKKLIAHKQRNEQNGNGFGWNPTTGGGLLTVLQQKQGTDQTQTLLLNRTGIAKQTEVAGTLMARDYKGFGNQPMTAVAEFEGGGTPRK